MRQILEGRFQQATFRDITIITWICRICCEAPGLNVVVQVAAKVVTDELGDMTESVFVRELSVPALALESIAGELLAASVIDAVAIDTDVSFRFVDLLDVHRLQSVAVGECVRDLLL